MREKNIVEFNFHVGDKVVDRFGKPGFIDDCAISKAGKRYWVVKEAQSCWEDEQDLKLAE
ncbi:MAG: hypothetical protein ACYC09_15145 [Bacteroidota bacterium]